MITVIYVAMLSAIFSIPFVIVFEFIIMEVLNRPTARSLSSVQSSDVDKQGAQEGSSDESLSVGEELRIVILGLWEHFRSVDADEKVELEKLWGLSCSQLEWCLETLPPTQSASPDAAHIVKKNTVRPGGVQGASNEATEVAVGRRRRSSWSRWTALALSNSDELIVRNLVKDLIAVRSVARKKCHEFEKLTPQQQGIRLLVLFQKDLLSGVTGEITEKKSMQGKTTERKAVSWWAKAFGVMFIVLLTLTMLFYIFLFAITQDQARQSAWIQSFIIWLALEVFLVSSLVMVMSQFVVPSLVFSEMKMIKTKMISMVHAYQSKMLLERPTTSDNYLADSSFDVTPYLFVSTRLARKYPQSLESKIIRDFKTTVPNRSYQRDKKSSTTLYRSRLRLTAVINSINLIFLYIIGLVMSLPTSSVELSFYDVLSWVAVGFSVLFQSILFADNPVAAFCVYAAFICVVGTFIYYYHKAARRLKSKSSAGVISIKAIWEERKKKENILEQSKLTSPEELIMRNIVSSLKAHDGQKAKYNPRYSKIMESLKTKPALRKREEEKMIGEENDGLTIHSCPERLDRHKGRVLIRFNVSRDGDSSSSADEDAELSTRSTSRYASHNRKANNKLHDVVNSSWSDLRRVSKTRKNAAEFVKKLKEELGLDSDLSDFSSDRYPDEPFKFSSFEDNDSDGDKAMTEVATPELTSREVEIQREVVEVFTKPLSVKTFARRIRRHREKLHRLSLERRAKDIEEEFKMSTRASRKSDLAHQTRTD
jgi:hypothetical protein